jgi:cytoskeletal protein RodZ
MEKIDKKVWVALILIVIFVVIFVFSNKNAPLQDEESAENTDTEVSVPSVQTPPTPTKPTVISKTSPKTSTTQTTPPTPPALSRKEALDAYDERVVRINNVCVSKEFAHMFNLNPGTVIMIDNDSSISHTIKLPARTITLSPYSYTLEKVSEGGAVVSSCNESTGVTTITFRPR